MARPKKSPDSTRTKWAVLNVLQHERETIQADAKEAGMGVSAFILRRTLRPMAVSRQDWKKIAQQQGELLRYLREIAEHVSGQEPTSAAVEVVIRLRRIEQSIFESSKNSDATFELAETP